MEDTKVRIVFRRGSLALKLAVLAVVTLSLFTLLVVWVYKQQAEKDYEDLKDQAIVLEQENSRLQEAIDMLGSIKSVAQIAKEKLGLVDPDTIIIEPEN